MKKIFTLLFVVGTFTMAQAQPGSRDNRQADTRYNQQTDQRGFNNGRDIVASNSYSNDSRYDSKFADRDRDRQIASINQEYAMKIEKVKRNFFMGWYEKQRQISFLQQQRDREISMVYAKSNGRWGRDMGHDDHFGRH